MSGVTISTRNIISNSYYDKQTGEQAQAATSEDSEAAIAANRTLLSAKKHLSSQSLHNP
jgi:hypothetical protein